ncbi:iron-sulfur cluster assembly accessory protein [Corallococcus exiguus]|uniref:Iron-sulfur cluster assembly accessory protein n=1 Tax=Corallococcus exiguus TaxID=83462 RepID=A0A7Y1SA10_9BACT|nr:MULTISPECIES: iron-sulfur cluster assembly accessory protein [Corallococcus]RKI34468.1 iron-sulfur cluster assembly accessory protein [Corallococcus sp. AB004]NBC42808.1 iron-sulfur cluster assembly accessory protein [Corallococcus exiguus]NNC08142.1 iron-sulfur cluster assembly accessory protein [Corallococcus exiguus]NNC21112.1 iron-sulfur cluster assembly accessory protein [Corallococcus exiguus]NPC75419.1 iron-sulfur cluster assembly accessory protein [Corallococcus exiguus]
MDTSTAVTGSTPASQPAASEPVVLTAAAIAQVKTVIQAQGFQGYFFSIRVVPSGCSGLGYDLNLVKEMKAGDQTWEQDGVTIATDALSAQYLSGTHIDYVTSVTGAGFKFENPNAKSSCGCGTSFTT